MLWQVALAAMVTSAAADSYLLTGHTEDDLVAQDLRCDELMVTQQFSGVDSERAQKEAEKRHTDCTESLEQKALAYAKESATSAKKPLDEWLEEHARYDKVLERYVLEVHGGRKNSRRYVYLPPHIQPKAINDTSRKPFDDIDAKYLAMLRRIRGEDRKEEEDEDNGVASIGKQEEEESVHPKEVEKDHSELVEEKERPKQDEHGPETGHGSTPAKHELFDSLGDLRRKKEPTSIEPAKGKYKPQITQDDTISDPNERDSIKDNTDSTTVGIGSKSNIQPDQKGNKDGPNNRSKKKVTFDINGKPTHDDSEDQGTPEIVETARPPSDRKSVTDKNEDKTKLQPKIEEKRPKSLGISREEEEDTDDDKASVKSQNKEETPKPIISSQSHGDGKSGPLDEKSDSSSKSEFVNVPYKKEDNGRLSGTTDKEPKNEEPKRTTKEEKKKKVTFDDRIHYIPNPEESIEDTNDKTPTISNAEAHQGVSSKIEEKHPKSLGISREEEEDTDDDKASLKSQSKEETPKPIISSERHGDGKYGSLDEKSDSSSKSEFVNVPYKKEDDGRLSGTTDEELKNEEPKRTTKEEKKKKVTFDDRIHYIPNPEESIEDTNDKTPTISNAEAYQGGTSKLAPTALTFNRDKMRSRKPGDTLLSLLPNQNNYLTKKGTATPNNQSQKEPEKENMENTSDKNIHTGTPKKEDDINPFKKKDFDLANKEINHKNHKSNNPKIEDSEPENEDSAEMGEIDNVPAPSDLRRENPLVEESKYLDDEDNISSQLGSPVDYAIQNERNAKPKRLNERTQSASNSGDEKTSRIEKNTPLSPDDNITTEDKKKVRFSETEKESNDLRKQTLPSSTTKPGKDVDSESHDYDGENKKEQNEPLPDNIDEMNRKGPNDNLEKPETTNVDDEAKTKARPTENKDSNNDTDRKIKKNKKVNFDKTKNIPYPPHSEDNIDSNKNKDLVPDNHSNEETLNNKLQRPETEAKEIPPLKKETSTKNKAPEKEKALGEKDKSFLSNILNHDDVKTRSIETSENTPELNEKQSTKDERDINEKLTKSGDRSPFDKKGKLLAINKIEHDKIKSDSTDISADISKKEEIVSKLDNKDIDDILPTSDHENPFNKKDKTLATNKMDHDQRKSDTPEISTDVPKTEERVSAPDNKAKDTKLPTTDDKNPFGKKDKSLLTKRLDHDQGKADTTEISADVPEKEERVSAPDNKAKDTKLPATDDKKPFNKKDKSVASNKINHDKLKAVKPIISSVRPGKKERINTKDDKEINAKLKTYEYKNPIDKKDKYLASNKLDNDAYDRMNDYELPSLTRYELPNSNNVENLDVLDRVFEAPKLESNEFIPESNSNSETKNGSEDEDKKDTDIKERKKTHPTNVKISEDETPFGKKVNLLANNKLDHDQEKNRYLDVIEKKINKDGSLSEVEIKIKPPATETPDRKIPLRKRVRSLANDIVGHDEAKNSDLEMSEENPEKKNIKTMKENKKKPTKIGRNGDEKPLGYKDGTIANNKISHDKAKSSVPGLSEEIPPKNKINIKEENNNNAPNIKTNRDKILVGKKDNLLANNNLEHDQAKNSLQVLSEIRRPKADKASDKDPFGEKTRSLTNNKLEHEKAKRHLKELPKGMPKEQNVKSDEEKKVNLVKSVTPDDEIPFSKKDRSLANNLLGSNHLKDSKFNLSEKTPEKRDMTNPKADMASDEDPFGEKERSLANNKLEHEKAKSHPRELPNEIPKGQDVKNDEEDKKVKAMKSVTSDDGIPFDKKDRSLANNVLGRDQLKDSKLDMSEKTPEKGGITRPRADKDKEKDLFGEKERSLANNKLEHEKEKSHPQELPDEMTKEQNVKGEEEKKANPLKSIPQEGKIPFDKKDRLLANNLLESDQLKDSKLEQSKKKPEEGEMARPQTDNASNEEPFSKKYRLLANNALEHEKAKGHPREQPSKITKEQNVIGNEEKKVNPSKSVPPDDDIPFDKKDRSLANNIFGSNQLKDIKLEQSKKKPEEGEMARPQADNASNEEPFGKKYRLLANNALDQEKIKGHPQELPNKMKKGQNVKGEEEQKVNPLKSMPTDDDIPFNKKDRSLANNVLGKLEQSKKKPEEGEMARPQADNASNEEPFNKKYRLLANNALEHEKAKGHPREQPSKITKEQNVIGNEEKKVNPLKSVPPDDDIPFDKKDRSLANNVLGSDQLKDSKLGQSKKKPEEGEMARPQADNASNEEPFGKKYRLLANNALEHEKAKGHPREQTSKITKEQNVIGNEEKKVNPLKSVPPDDDIPFDKDRSLANNVLGSDQLKDSKLEQSIKNPEKGEITRPKGNKSKDEDLFGEKERSLANNKLDHEKVKGHPQELPNEMPKEQNVKGEEEQKVNPLKSSPTEYDIPFDKKDRSLANNVLGSDQLKDSKLELSEKTPEIEEMSLLKLDKDSEEDPFDETDRSLANNKLDHEKAKSHPPGLPNDKQKYHDVKGEEEKKMNPLESVTPDDDSPFVNKDRSLANNVLGRDQLKYSKLDLSEKTPEKGGITRPKADKDKEKDLFGEKERSLANNKLDHEKIKGHPQELPTEMPKEQNVKGEEEKKVNPLKSMRTDDDIPFDKKDRSLANNVLGGDQLKYSKLEQSMKKPEKGEMERPQADNASNEEPFGKKYRLLANNALEHEKAKGHPREQTSKITKEQNVIGNEEKKVNPLKSVPPDDDIPFDKKDRSLANNVLGSDQLKDSKLEQSIKNPEKGEITRPKGNKSKDEDLFGEKERSLANKKFDHEKVKGHPLELPNEMPKEQNVKGEEEKKVNPLKSMPTEYDIPFDKKDRSLANNVLGSDQLKDSKLELSEKTPEIEEMSLLKLDKDSEEDPFDGTDRSLANNKLDHEKAKIHPPGLPNDKQKYHDVIGEEEKKMNPLESVTPDNDSPFVKKDRSLANNVLGRDQLKDSKLDLSEKTLEKEGITRSKADKDKEKDLFGEKERSLANTKLDHEKIKGHPQELPTEMPKEQNVKGEEEKKVNPLKSMPTDDDIPFDKKDRSLANNVLGSDQLKYSKLKQSMKKPEKGEMARPQADNASNEEPFGKKYRLLANNALEHEKAKGHPREQTSKITKEQNVIGNEEKKVNPLKSVPPDDDIPFDKKDRSLANNVLGSDQLKDSKLEQSIKNPEKGEITRPKGNKSKDEDLFGEKERSLANNKLDHEKVKGHPQELPNKMPKEQNVKGEEEKKVNPLKSMPTEYDIPFDKKDRSLANNVLGSDQLKDSKLELSEKTPEIEEMSLLKLEKDSEEDPFDETDRSLANNKLDHEKAKSHPPGLPNDKQKYHDVKGEEEKKMNPLESVTPDDDSPFVKKDRSLANNVLGRDQLKYSKLDLSEKTPEKGGITRPKSDKDKEKDLFGEKERSLANNKLDHEKIKGHPQELPTEMPKEQNVKGEEEKKVNPLKSMRTDDDIPFDKKDRSLANNVLGGDQLKYSKLEQSMKKPEKGEMARPQADNASNEEPFGKKYRLLANNALEHEKAKGHPREQTSKITKEQNVIGNEEKKVNPLKSVPPNDDIPFDKKDRSLANNVLGSYQLKDSKLEQSIKNPEKGEITRPKGNKSKDEDLFGEKERSLANNKFDHEKVKGHPLELPNEMPKEQNVKGEEEKKVNPLKSMPTEYDIPFDKKDRSLANNVLGSDQLKDSKLELSEKTPEIEEMSLLKLDKDSEEDPFDGTDRSLANNKLDHEKAKIHPPGLPNDKQKYHDVIGEEEKKMNPLESVTPDNDSPFVKKDRSLANNVLGRDQLKDSKLDLSEKTLEKEGITRPKADKDKEKDLFGEKERSLANTKLDHEKIKGHPQELPTEMPKEQNVKGEGEKKVNPLKSMPTDDDIPFDKKDRSLANNVLGSDQLKYSKLKQSMKKPEKGEMARPQADNASNEEPFGKKYRLLANNALEHEKAKGHPREQTSKITKEQNVIGNEEKKVNPLKSVPPDDDIPFDKKDRSLANNVLGSDQLKDSKLEQSIKNPEKGEITRPKGNKSKDEDLFGEKERSLANNKLDHEKVKGHPQELPNEMPKEQNVKGEEEKKVNPLKSMPTEYDIPFDKKDRSLANNVLGSDQLKDSKLELSEKTPEIEEMSLLKLDKDSEEDPFDETDRSLANNKLDHEKAKSHPPGLPNDKQKYHDVKGEEEKKMNPLESVTPDDDSPFVKKDRSLANNVLGRDQLKYSKLDLSEKTPEKGGITRPKSDKDKEKDLFGEKERSLANNKLDHEKIKGHPQELPTEMPKEQNVKGEEEKKVNPLKSMRTDDDIPFDKKDRSLANNVLGGDQLKYSKLEQSMKKPEKGEMARPQADNASNEEPFGKKYRLLANNALEHEKAKGHPREQTSKITKEQNVIGNEEKKVNPLKSVPPNDDIPFDKKDRSLANNVLGSYQLKDSKLEQSIKNPEKGEITRPKGNKSKDEDLFGEKERSLANNKFDHEKVKGHPLELPNEMPKEQNVKGEEEKKVNPLKSMRTDDDIPFDKKDRSLANNVLGGDQLKYSKFEQSMKKPEKGEMARPQADNASNEEPFGKKYRLLANNALEHEKAKGHPREQTSKITKEQNVIGNEEKKVNPLKSVPPNDDIPFDKKDRSLANNVLGSDQLKDSKLEQSIKNPEKGEITRPKGNKSKDEDLFGEKVRSLANNKFDHEKVKGHPLELPNEMPKEQNVKGEEEKKVNPLKSMPTEYDIPFDKKDRSLANNVLGSDQLKDSKLELSEKTPEIEEMSLLKLDKDSEEDPFDGTDRSLANNKLDHEKAKIHPPGLPNDKQKYHDVIGEEEKKMNPLESVTPDNDSPFVKKDRSLANNVLGRDQLKDSKLDLSEKTLEKEGITRPKADKDKEKDLFGEKERSLVNTKLDHEKIKGHPQELPTEMPKEQNVKGEEEKKVNPLKSMPTDDDIPFDKKDRSLANNVLGSDQLKYSKLKQSMKKPEKGEMARPQADNASNEEPFGKKYRLLANNALEHEKAKGHPREQTSKITKEQNVIGNEEKKVNPLKSVPPNYDIPFDKKDRSLANNVLGSDQLKDSKLEQSIKNPEKGEITRPKGNKSKDEDLFVEKERSLANNKFDHEKVKGHPLELPNEMPKEQNVKGEEEKKVNPLKSMPTEYDIPFDKKDRSLANNVLGSDQLKDSKLELSEKTPEIEEMSLLKLDKDSEEDPFDGTDRSLANNKLDHEKTKSHPPGLPNDKQKYHDVKGKEEKKTNPLESVTPDNDSPFVKKDRSLANNVLGRDQLKDSKLNLSEKTLEKGGITRPKADKDKEKDLFGEKERSLANNKLDHEKIKGHPQELPTEMPKEQNVKGEEEKKVNPLKSMPTDDDIPFDKKDRSLANNVLGNYQLKYSKLEQSMKKPEKGEMARPQADNASNEEPFGKKYRLLANNALEHEKAKGHPREQTSKITKEQNVIGNEEKKVNPLKSVPPNDDIPFDKKDRSLANNVLGSDQLKDSKLEQSIKNPEKGEITRPKGNKSKDEDLFGEKERSLANNKFDHEKVKGHPLELPNEMPKEQNVKGEEEKKVNPLKSMPTEYDIPFDKKDRSLANNVLGSDQLKDSKLELSEKTPEIEEMSLLKLDKDSEEDPFDGTYRSLANNKLDHEKAKSHPPGLPNDKQKYHDVKGEEEKKMNPLESVTPDNDSPFVKKDRSLANNVLGRDQLKDSKLDLSEKTLEKGGITRPKADKDKEKDPFGEKERSLANNKLDHEKIKGHPQELPTEMPKEQNVKGEEEKKVNPLKSMPTDDDIPFDKKDRSLANNVLGNYQLKYSKLEQSMKKPEKGEMARPQADNASNEEPFGKKYRLLANNALEHEKAKGHPREQTSKITKEQNVIGNEEKKVNPLKSVPPDDDIPFDKKDRSLANNVLGSDQLKDSKLEQSIKNPEKGEITRPKGNKSKDEDLFGEKERSLANNKLDHEKVKGHPQELPNEMPKEQNVKCEEEKKVNPLKSMPTEYDIPFDKKDRSLANNVLGSDQLKDSKLELSEKTPEIEEMSLLKLDKDSEEDPFDETDRSLANNKLDHEKAKSHPPGLPNDKQKYHDVKGEEEKKMNPLESVTPDDDSPFVKKDRSLANNVLGRDQLKYSKLDLSEKTPEKGGITRPKADKDKEKDLFGEKEGSLANNKLDHEKVKGHPQELPNEMPKEQNVKGKEENKVNPLKSVPPDDDIPFDKKDRSLANNVLGSDQLKDSKLEVSEKTPEKGQIRRPKADRASDEDQFGQKDRSLANNKVEHEKTKGHPRDQPNKMPKGLDVKGEEEKKRNPVKSVTPDDKFPFDKNDRSLANNVLRSDQLKDSKLELSEKTPEKGEMRRPKAGRVSDENPFGEKDRSLANNKLEDDKEKNNFLEQLDKTSHEQDVKGEEEKKANPVIPVTRDEEIPFDEKDKSFGNNVLGSDQLMDRGSVLFEETPEKRDSKNKNDNKMRPLKEDRADDRDSLGKNERPKDGNQLFINDSIVSNNRLEDKKLQSDSEHDSEKKQKEVVSEKTNHPKLKISEDKRKITSREHILSDTKSKSEDLKSKKPVINKKETEKKNEEVISDKKNPLYLHTATDENKNNPILTNVQTEHDKLDDSQPLIDEEDPKIEGKEIMPDNMIQQKPKAPEGESFLIKNDHNPMNNQLENKSQTSNVLSSNEKDEQEIVPRKNKTPSTKEKLEVKKKVSRNEKNDSLMEIPEEKEDIEKNQKLKDQAQNPLKDDTEKEEPVKRPNRKLPLNEDIDVLDIRSPTVEKEKKASDLDEDSKTPTAAERNVELKTDQEQEKIYPKESEIPKQRDQIYLEPLQIDKDPQEEISHETKKDFKKKPKLNSSIHNDKIKKKSSERDQGTIEDENDKVNEQDYTMETSSDIDKPASPMEKSGPTKVQNAKEEPKQRNPMKDSSFPRNEPPRSTSSKPSGNLSENNKLDRAENIADKGEESPNNSKESKKITERPTSSKDTQFNEINHNQPGHDKKPKSIENALPENKIIQENPLKPNDKSERNTKISPIRKENPISEDNVNLTDNQLQRKEKNKEPQEYIPKTKPHRSRNDLNVKDDEDVYSNPHANKTPDVAYQNEKEPRDLRNAKVDLESIDSHSSNIVNIEDASSKELKDKKKLVDEVEESDYKEKRDRIKYPLETRSTQPKTNPEDKSSGSDFGDVIEPNTINIEDVKIAPTPNSNSKSPHFENNQASQQLNRDAPPQLTPQVTSLPPQTSSPTKVQPVQISSTTIMNPASAGGPVQLVHVSSQGENIDVIHYPNKSPVVVLSSPGNTASNGNVKNQTPLLSTPSTLSLNYPSSSSPTSQIKTSETVSSIQDRVSQPMNINFMHSVSYRENNPPGVTHDVDASLYQDQNGRKPSTLGSVAVVNLAAPQGSPPVTNHRTSSPTPTAPSRQYAEQPKSLSKSWYKFPTSSFFGG